MITKHRIQLLSTTKGDLRPRLANPQSKFAKLKFFQLVITLDLNRFHFFLLKTILLILRVWVTNWAQTANGIFEKSNNSTYISLPKTCTWRIIPVKLFQRIYLSRADASRQHLSTAFMRVGFFNPRVHARKVLARPHDQLVRTLAPPQSTQAREQNLFNVAVNEKALSPLHV